MFVSRIGKLDTWGMMLDIQETSATVGVVQVGWASKTDRPAELPGDGLRRTHGGEKMVDI